MNYLEVYHSRVNHLGQTTAERIRNGGIRSFEKWLAESPHTIQDLSIERGLYFNGIILTNKDKEYQKIMFLNVSNSIPLQVGDIMNWEQEDATIEKWLLFSEEKKVNGTYRTFSIIRCNYLLKWIDALGHLQSSWAYVVSSLDSKIKGNYRTWNALITPQPNKYAEILMPRRVIDRATNFIIEEESWQVIEYDHTSVPGTIYLSLTENKINMVYDDVPNGIADTDKRAIYTLALPETIQVFNINEPIEPIYTIMKNGIPVNMRVEYTSLNKEVARLKNNVLTAVGNGETDIAIKLLDCDDIEQEPLIIHIKVGSEETEFSCYIKGNDKIRLDREQIYMLCSTNDDSIITSNISFTINDTSLATITNTINNSCTVHANNNNKLGMVELIASYGNQIYTKTIRIVPLW